MKFPNRKDVDKYKKTLLPQSIQSTDNKTCVDVTEVITDTVENILKLNPVREDLKEIRVVGKFGLDGSGSHPTRNQLNSVNEKDEDVKGNCYISSFWCPLSISDMNGNSVWQNPSPNSITYSRPVVLVKTKESRENVEKHFTDTLIKLKTHESEPIHTSQGIQICSHTEVSMTDGKMTSILQGDSGSFCHYCTTSRADANDPVVIADGFVINKTIDECRETWEAMERGEISYNDPGKKKQSKFQIKYFPITNSTSFLSPENLSNY